MFGERIADLTIPDPITQRKYQDADLPCNGVDVEVTWPAAARATSATGPSKDEDATMTNPLSFAEIDTCTPYQPFHLDRHVELHAFANSNYKMGPYDRWVFGEEMQTRPVNEAMETESAASGMAVLRDRLSDLQVKEGKKEPEMTNEAVSRSADKQRPAPHRRDPPEPIAYERRSSKVEREDSEDLIGGVSVASRSVETLSRQPEYLIDHEEASSPNNEHLLAGPTDLTADEHDAAVNQLMHEDQPSSFEEPFSMRKHETPPFEPPAPEPEPDWGLAPPIGKKRKKKKKTKPAEEDSEWGAVDNIGEHESPPKEDTGWLHAGTDEH